MKTIAHYILPLLALFSLSPWISSGTALLMGILTSIIFGNPYNIQTKKLGHTFLSLAVMGLGAGMNLRIIGTVGLAGIGYTIVGIVSAFFFGNILGKILKIEKNTSLLITVGTAICGGSAIAAVASVVRARSHEVSVALGIVFMLNALALFIFPWIGHYLNLSEAQFGLWSALAIHDTSSVVGATLHYGPQALEVGTTVKLARALWIIPVAMLIGIVRSRNQKSSVAENQKGKRPWFILGFLLAAALVTFFPSLQPAGHNIEIIAKKLMILTLFLIGTNLTKETIKSVGIKPFIQGIALWSIMAIGTLSAVTLNLINI
ncbi:MAG: putative sulfate exporter family transporter [Oligoflexia bacterium]|nr:putative sulfate exporter family transporter [Oligoflexia bacterium]